MNRNRLSHVNKDYKAFSLIVLQHIGIKIVWVCLAANTNWFNAVSFVTYTIPKCEKSLKVRSSYDDTSYNHLKFFMFNMIERVPWKLVDRVRILVEPHRRHKNGTCGLTILVLRVDGQGQGKGSRGAAVDSPPVQHSLRKQQHGQQRMQADMALQTTSDTPKSSKRVYLSVLSLDSDVCLFLHLLFDHFWCFCAVLKCFEASSRYCAASFKMHIKENDYHMIWPKFLIYTWRWAVNTKTCLQRFHDHMLHFHQNNVQIQQLQWPLQAFILLQTTKSDIFSLGLCFYVIFTKGYHVYGKDWESHYYLIKNDGKKSFDQLLPPLDESNPPQWIHRQGMFSL